MRVLVGLFWCAHPMPSLAITTFTSAIALVAEAEDAPAIAVVVLLGQASIGWSNDVLDRHSDRSARRRDKPLVRGDVPDAAVAVTAGTALAFSLVLAFTISGRTGLVNAVALAAGWLYNMGLKRHWSSPVPYAVHFALVPAALVSTSLAGSPLPQARLAFTSSLLGISAHFANTIPDTAADLVTGVRGLPQRLGPATSARISAVVLLAAGVLLVGMPAATVSRALAVAAIVAALAYAVLVTGPRAIRDRRIFTVNLVVIALLVASFLTAGQRLAGTG